MKSMIVKFAVLALIVGLLSACAGPATEVPATQPNVEAASPTEAPATEPPAATEPAAVGATVSFSTDIQPLIESRCINCHGGERTQKGLDMKTYAALMAGSENGPVVMPGDAANSKMAELVLNQKMPKRGPKLTPDQAQLIVDWINQGALEN